MKTKMNAQRVAVLAALFALAAGPQAQAQDKVFRSINAVAGKEARLGIIAEVKDCKNAPPPDVKVMTAPKNGTFTLRGVTGRAGTFRACPKLEAQAQALFYFPKSDYTGADEIVYEVKRTDGRTSVVTVKIDVSGKAKPNPKPADGIDL